MHGVLIPRVLRVFRLRSVRFSKHRAHCNALLWSSERQEDSQLHQHNQEGRPSSAPTLAVAAVQVACLLSSPLPPISIAVTSGPGEQCQSLERQRWGKRERTERKAGTTCSSRLVRAASRRQPKGMGNVCAALSGLHELYMTCYVKMLPVYCVYIALFSPPPPFFFPLTPSLPPSFTLSFSPPLLSRAQSLLFFSVTKYSLVVKC